MVTSVLLSKKVGEVVQIVLRGEANYFSDLITHGLEVEPVGHDFESVAEVKDMTAKTNKRKRSMRTKVTCL
jgi:hypothetical protein